MINSQPLPTKTLTPTEAAFRQALATYRKRWPQDGYYNYEARFVETYRLLRTYATGNRILDVGGWPGDFSCTLASMGLDIILLDKDISRAIRKRHDEISQTWVLEGVTTLDDRCREYGVRTLECDVEHESIPLEDHSIDVVVFTEVIEHLRVGLLNALRELNRVLRPDGKLFVSTPNLLSLQNRLSFLLGRADYDTLELPFAALAAEERIGHGGHFRVFSMPELNDLLSNMGFKIEYRCYRHLSAMREQNAGWTLYDCRMKAQRWLSQTVESFGNTIFLVCSRA